MIKLLDSPIMGSPFVEDIQMEIIIGSARSDERKTYTGGKVGDQRQFKSPDYSGEVSMQKFYVHSKGWNIIRAKGDGIAYKLAKAMQQACNNSNIGYSQSDRYGVIKYGTGATQKCNADCSSLVRQCVKEASGIDPGDFTTGNAANKLVATGIFNKVIPYTTDTILYEGDILCTKTKGHIVIVTSGHQRRADEQYYSKYTGNSESLVDALNSLGINSSKENRTKIANANSIVVYEGTASQNQYLLGLLKLGKLIKM